MDATVNDFLKEINEIAPPKSKTRVKPLWKECFDKASGFCYYWNTQTDEVTWDVPDMYKKDVEEKLKNKPVVPPKAGANFRGKLSNEGDDNVRVYKLDESKRPKAPPKREIKDDSENRRVIKRPRKGSSDSEDEKIVLISSYGGETESESEDEDRKQKQNTKHIEKDAVLGPRLLPDHKYTESSPTIGTDKSKPSSLNNSDVDDDTTDLLTKIQNKAKELKELGGELPEDVKKLVADDSSNSESVNFEKRDLTGFSLVAGYGADSDDEDDSEIKTLFPVKPPSASKVSHSTLFPIAPPIDIKQFQPELVEKPKSVEENVDVKAFQRKRRIGIDLVNAQKKKAEDVVPDQNSERRGFGFKSGAVEYSGFKSGGVMFVKSDTLHQQETAKENDTGSEAKDVSLNCKDKKLLKEIEGVQVSLREKLNFLCEGHNPTLPVQVMIIQMETLYAAMKANCLLPTYLKKWLSETCEALIKLEKDAAPNGWLLQWDRLHKRYYYHNQTSGESQWEYPQPDIVGGEDAMDISTTPPPPNEEHEHSTAHISMNMLVPPPPPKIKEKSISPPPPPVISGCKMKPEKENAIESSEPLPPGVDATDDPKFEVKSNAKVNQETTNNDRLTSALDSFYSDLAAIEVPNISGTDAVESIVSVPVVPVEQPVPVQPVKKKKTKVKLAHGLAMKKKGVSKLVEKWKSVQKSLE